MAVMLSVTQGSVISSRLPHYPSLATIHVALAICQFFGQSKNVRVHHSGIARWCAYRGAHSSRKRLVAPTSADTASVLGVPSLAGSGVGLLVENLRLPAGMLICPPNAVVANLGLLAAAATRQAETVASAIAVPTCCCARDCLSV